MQPYELTDTAVKYILEHTDTSRLNEWEVSFFESVSDQYWAGRKNLTDGQKEILGQIWDNQL
jgi:hypothetical protein